MTPQPEWPASFTIAPAKITAYLLDPLHVDGGPKCAFLATFGYTPQKPDDLRRAILIHAQRENFRKFVPARRATKLYFEGPLPSLTPDRPNVRTVWQMDDDDPTRSARFVTLRPLPKASASPHAP